MDKLILLAVATALLQATFSNRTIENASHRSLRPDILEMHILANRRTMDHAELDDLIAEFRAGSPLAPSDGYRWFPVQHPELIKRNEKIVAEMRNNRTYILALMSPTASLDSRTHFLITHFDKEEKSPPFGWIIRMEFDEEGATQLERMTRKNIGSTIGTFLLGELVIQGTVMDPITRGRLALSGFPDDIERTYQTLLKNTVESRDP